PPIENCSNGIDDDCNMLSDAADPWCAALCPGSAHIDAPGGRYTTALVPHVYQGTCGGAGAEAYFDFVLTSAQDVFLTTHEMNGVNTVLYVRSMTCTGTQVAMGCNNDADGLVTSTLRLNLAAGRYMVFVDSVGGVSSGTAVLDAYFSTPGLVTDRCGRPGFIAAGTTSLSGNIIGYSNDYTSVGCNGGREDRVFYFYLPTARAVTFDGCHPIDTFDQSAYLRSVCSDGTAGGQVTCNDDDACGGSPAFCDSGQYNSGFTTTIGPGLFYFISDGWGFYGNGCDTIGAYTYAITGL
ncbi:MAG: hypothetical protein FD127_4288, partial [Acidimicrobiaceae bacterium]